jgi:hypothetical protein
MESLNEHFIRFIMDMDLRKSKENNVKEWIKYSKTIDHSANEKPTRKNTKRKNPYLFFADDMRDIVKQQYPGLTSNKDVLGKIGEEWAKLKKLDNDQYKSYLKMSLDYSTNAENDYNEPEEVVYQVTKPFHKFSLEKRKELVDANPDLSSSEITELLIKQWKLLNKTEKAKWKL